MWSVFPFAVPHLAHWPVSYFSTLSCLFVFLFDLMSVKYDFALVLPFFSFYFSFLLLLAAAEAACLRFPTSFGAVAGRGPGRA